MGLELTPEWAFDACDHGAMEEALAEARLAGEAGEVPVGAVVVDGRGAVLGRGRNRREGTGDPTAHAEVEALRSAGSGLGRWQLAGCTLYVTLEPCAMCAAACALARLEGVVWGAPDPRGGFAGSLANLLDDPRLPDRVHLRCGLRRQDSAALLERFFAKLRNGG